MYEFKGFCLEIQLAVAQLKLNIQWKQIFFFIWTVLNPYLYKRQQAIQPIDNKSPYVNDKFNINLVLLFTQHYIPLFLLSVKKILQPF